VQSAYCLCPVFRFDCSVMVVDSLCTVGPLVRVWLQTVTVETGIYP
jgi:hypothetical protein